MEFRIAGLAGYASADALAGGGWLARTRVGCSDALCRRFGYAGFEGF
jgi:hypothetical protein